MPHFSALLHGIVVLLHFGSMYEPGQYGVRLIEEWKFHLVLAPAWLMLRYNSRLGFHMLDVVNKLTLPVVQCIPNSFIYCTEKL